jgi:hypothetical protein
VPKLIPDLKLAFNNNFPIVVCGNNCHIKDRKVDARNIDRLRRFEHLHYYDISTEVGFNVDKPLLWLARELSDNSDLDDDEDSLIADLQQQVADLQQQVAALQQQMLASATKQDEILAILHNKED